MSKFAVVEKQFEYKGHDCICIFGCRDLEIDEENQWYCIRCDKCKQAEEYEK